MQCWWRLHSAQDQHGVEPLLPPTCPSDHSFRGTKAAWRMSFSRGLRSALGCRTLAVVLVSVSCGFRPSPNSTDPAIAGNTCSPSTPRVTQLLSLKSFPLTPQGPGLRDSLLRYSLLQGGGVGHREPRAPNEGCFENESRPTEQRKRQPLRAVTQNNRRLRNVQVQAVSGRQDWNVTQAAT